ncbi:MAG: hypothetical protein WC876_02920 [Candidatus Thermoplasmatota archaeon]|jgi:hypothetical protein
MRGLATLLTILFLLAPLAAAQGGEGSESKSSTSSHSESSSSSSESDRPESESQSSTTPPPEPREGDGCPLPRERPDNQTELDACKERYCEENRDDARCDQGDEAEDGPRPPAGWERWCRDEAREDAQRERCRQALDDFESTSEGDGHWISFQVDAANSTILNYTVAEGLVLDAIHLETGSDNLTVHRAGSTVRVGDEDSELILHDDPTGLVRFKGDDGSLTLVLAEGSVVDPSQDGAVARIQLPDGRIAHLRSENATWLDNRTVLMTGFGALLVPPAEPVGRPDDAEREDREEKMQDAIEDRKVGAEITLRGPPAMAALSDGNGSVEVLAYDDVEVQVQLPSGQIATPDAPIRIEVSAELDEGRTIVLNLNRSLLENLDPDSLVLRYFDLHAQADGSVVETEVVIRMASSLQDILDPTDDLGQPEYWVVEDANGLQAMFTIPHWSAHAITVGSLALITSPNVLAGLAIGVAGSVVAAAVMFWPRKPEDD